MVTYFRLWEWMQMKEDYKLVPCFEFAEELCEDSRRHISIFVKKYSNPCECQSVPCERAKLVRNSYMGRKT
jgi:hypothetical protein